jgi:hypothetical protein
MEPGKRADQQSKLKGVTHDVRPQTSDLGLPTSDFGSLANLNGFRPRCDVRSLTSEV